MKLYTLGTSHGATEKGRECSGNLIEVNGTFYLFDCGGNVEGRMTNMDLPIENIRAVFVTHFHEDHIGSLSSIVKRFTVYLKDKKIKMYLPEKNGIEAFKNWIYALHLPLEDEVEFDLVTNGFVYSDENITVKAIKTKHIENGKYPSYAYEIHTADKKFLYTGDLSATFEDYPDVLAREEFDAVLSELVHFDFDKNKEKLFGTKTKHLIFTHTAERNVVKLEKVKDTFDYPISIASDGDCYKI